MPSVESSIPKPIIEGPPQGSDAFDIGVTPTVAEAAQAEMESAIVHAVHNAGEITRHAGEASKQKVVRTMALFRDLEGRLS